MPLTFDLAGLAPEAPSPTDFTDVELEPPTPTAATPPPRLEERRLSPAVTFLLLVYEGSRGGACEGILEISSRILHTAATAASIMIAVLWIIRHDILMLHRIDWFGAVVFGVFALGEVLLFVSRLFARYRHLGKGRERPNPEQTSLFGMLQQLIHRDPFGATWQAVVVLTIQAFVGLVSLFGFLVVVAELMGNTGTPETGFTWSVLFVFLAGAYCYTGFCDALRIPEVDFSNGWYLALEFSAWRAILCTIVCPLLAGAYVVYCRVCCPGRWELVPQLWFLQPGAAIAE